TADGNSTMLRVRVCDCAMGRAWSGQMHTRRVVRPVIGSFSALSAGNCTNAARATSDWQLAAAVDA
ncbi:MAG: hypothetical protein WEE89_12695, partial [Gemmatimonadota bacterium]